MPHLHISVFRVYVCAISFVPSPCDLFFPWFDLCCKSSSNKSKQKDLILNFESIDILAFERHTYVLAYPHVVSQTDTIKHKSYRKMKHLKAP